MGWQRIETAPKDGTRILIWALAGDDHPIAQAHFASWEDWEGQNGHPAGAGIWRGHVPDGDDYYSEGWTDDEVTHWMPVPLEIVVPPDQAERAGLEA